MLAAGFFDGLHRGHRAVLDRAIAAARKAGGESWALTFDRHPLSVLDPRSAPQLLVSRNRTVSILGRIGLDGCVALGFTKRLASMSAEEFVARLKEMAPPLAGLFVGAGWRFGRDAGGDCALLAKLLGDSAVKLVAVPPVCRKGKPISSSRIRAAISEGNLQEAEIMLGRPFSLWGQVVRGSAIGGKIGFPTANLAVVNQVLPPDGVYAVESLIGGQACPGALYIGMRPTFRRENPRRGVELHLIDYSGGLYDRDLEVVFARKLRGERIFDSTKRLQAGIARDIVDARAVLARNKPSEKLNNWL